MQTDILLQAVSGDGEVIGKWWFKWLGDAAHYFKPQTKAAWRYDQKRIRVNDGIIFYHWEDFPTAVPNKAQFSEEDNFQLVGQNVEFIQDIFNEEQKKNLIENRKIHILGRRGYDFEYSWLKTPQHLIEEYNKELKVT